MTINVFVDLSMTADSDYYASHTSFDQGLRS